MPAAKSTARRGPRARRAPREPTAIAEIARELLPIPTVSYAEHGVLGYVRRFAEERGLGFELDRFGNGYVRHSGRRRRGGGARPLVLGAHVDHPGFVVTAVRGRRLELEFRGGLPASYGRGERVGQSGEFGLQSQCSNSTRFKRRGGAGIRRSAD